MKGAIISIHDKLLLRKRAIIETVNDKLKNIAQVKHSKHRYFDYFIVNLLGTILSIACLQISCASIYKGILTHGLRCSEFIEFTLVMYSTLCYTLLSSTVLILCYLCIAIKNKRVAIGESSHCN